MPEKRDPEPVEAEEVGLQRIEDEPQLGGGVRELAKAFRLNAEILRRIQETQQDIAGRLERSDRSEMVIRSADSLNETFRGVRSTQKALLERLEETRSRHGRALLLVGAAAIVAVAGLVLGARWLVERTQEETRREVAEAWREDRRARDDALESAARLRDDVEAARRGAEEAGRLRTETERELETAAAEIRRLEGRLQALESLPRQLDEMRSDLRVREDRLAERDARIVALDKEILRLQRLEGELTTKLEAAEQAMAELRAELARREGLGPPRARAEETPRTEPEVPPGAETNAGQIQGLLAVLNRLLGQSGGEERWRLEEVRGVSGRKLLGVRLRNYGLGVRLVKIVRAAEAECVLRPARRELEIRLFQGSVEYSGAEAEFYRNRYVIYVSGIDPEAWRRAGLTVLGEE